MEKSVHVSMLLEIYGKLLTDKQRDIVDLYYNDNLSLSEIAEELGITRQGVHKNLIDAENKLFDYEEKLMILKNKLETQEELKRIIETTSDENTKKCLTVLVENTFRRSSEFLKIVEIRRYFHKSLEK